VARPCDSIYKNKDPMRRIPLISLLLCISLSACAGGHRDRSLELKQPLAPRTSKVKLPPTEIVRKGHLLLLNYEGFTVWLDCEQRSAVKWRYNAQHDDGNLPRANGFKLDPYVPKDCQQTSAKGYTATATTGATKCRRITWTLQPWRSSNRTT